MAETRLRDGVLQLLAPGTDWLSTGWAGGRTTADAAYNCTVPDGWGRTDLDQYVTKRRTEAGFELPGPTLLTGVEMRHARCGRLTAELAAGEPADVLAVVTAGVSNPAVLCSDDDSSADNDSSADDDRPAADDSAGDANATPLRQADDSHTGPSEWGTVNLLVHVEHPLTAGALANLVAVTAEAKTATLLRETGFPGTTTDALVVGAASGSDGDDQARFSGSGTPIGAAVRVCVRDALRASLRSRYVETPLPERVEDAEYGTVATASADVFRP